MEKSSTNHQQNMRFYLSEVNIVMFNANIDRGEGGFQRNLCIHEQPRIDTNSGSRPH